MLGLVLGAAMSRCAGWVITTGGTGRGCSSPSWSVCCCCGAASATRRGDQREAEKNRQLAAINREIDETGRVRELLPRRYEIERHYRPLQQAERARRSWCGTPIAWPRRALRWIAIGLLIASMIQLGIAFYGAMFLLPSAGGLVAGYFLIGVWAVLPAVVALPVGGWLAWWWVARMRASRRRWPVSRVLPASETPDCAGTLHSLCHGLG